MREEVNFDNNGNMKTRTLDFPAINLEDDSEFDQVSMATPKSPLSDLTAMYSSVEEEHSEETLQECIFPLPDENPSPTFAPLHKDDGNTDISSQLNEIVMDYSKDDEGPILQERSLEPEVIAQKDVAEFAPPFLKENLEVFEQEKESAFNPQDWEIQKNKLKNIIIIILIVFVLLLLIFKQKSSIKNASTPVTLPNLSKEKSIDEKNQSQDEVSENNNYSEEKETVEVSNLSTEVLEQCVIILESSSSYANRDMTRILAKTNINNALKTLKKIGADENIIAYTETIYNELSGDGDRDTIFNDASELNDYVLKCQE